MVFLQGVGVSTSLAVKIYKKYGDESVETVKREPYRLAADIWGSVSGPPTRSPRRSASRDSPEQIRAGLAFTLSAAADDGHCYLPVRELVAEGVKILGVPQEVVAEQVPDLAVEEPAVCDKVPGDDGVTEAVYLPPFFHSERSVASSLTRLLVARDDRLAVFQSVDWDRVLGHGAPGSSLPRLPAGRRSAWRS